MPKKTSNARNAAAAQLGKEGGKKGGPARAKKLSSLERSQIASEGGKAKAKNNPKKPK